MPEKKLIDRHLCFVCDRSWPLFSDVNAQGIGGVETRSVRLAEMMANYFTKVTYAIKNPGGKIINNRALDISFYEPATISNAPNPGLARINADIYIVFESNHITADAVRTCNIIGRPVVFWATSVNDYHIQYKLEDHKAYLFDFVARESAYCLYLSDYIISQTFDQKKVLIENHGLNSIVIKNPVPVNEDSFNVSSKRRLERDVVLWVGRTDPYNKRPDLLLEIAARLRNVDFVMILNNINDEYYKRIFQKKTSNIEIIDYVPPDKMNEIFEKCSVYLSTSSKEFEGFPNVMLQAICHALSIVSLEVDPDGIFSNHDCGICCKGNIDLVVHEIEILITDVKKKKSVIDNAFNYVKLNHSVELIEKQMVEFFSSIPFSVKNKQLWTRYNFNRLTEKLQSEYNQLELDYQNLYFNYSSLLNNRIIRKLNIMRKLIGKKQWL